MSNQEVSGPQWLFGQVALVGLFAVGAYIYAVIDQKQQTLAARGTPTPLPTPILTEISPPCKTIQVDNMALGLHLTGYDYNVLPILTFGGLGLKPEDMTRITINYSPLGKTQPNGTSKTIEPKKISPEQLAKELKQKLELQDTVCISYLGLAEAPSLTPTPNPSEGGKGFVPSVKKLGKNFHPDSGRAKPVFSKNQFKGRMRS